MNTPLQDTNAAFRAFLDTLNAAQRQAVEQVEGPVLVLAGPGTGKTHVLSARVGKILLDTDARTQNILCLTFSDAGAQAMRKRLQSRIGAEAQRVPVFTFHAYCNRVIQDNPEYFGRRNLEPVSDLDRIAIIRKLIEQLPPEHPLREGRRRAFTFEKPIHHLFQTMKKEGWTPGQVLKNTDAYLRSLPLNPDFVYKKTTRHGKAGEPKQAQIEKEKEKMQRLSAAADLYPKYLASMENAGFYDYEDMLLWVIRAFEKNEALLRDYQERYQYLLVDEFQDTNGAQYQLLNLLLDFWDTPNVFIVGDDDQSIYEFQGARLENLLNFYARYREGLTTIVLEENYRSTQPILDLSGRVIENNTLRLIGRLDTPLHKNLRAHSTEPAAFPKIQVFENRLHELSALLQGIEARLAAGVPPEEIAVLYAQHKQAERLMQLLEQKGIAYQTRRPVNLLDQGLIRQFRDLLQYLYEETQRPFSGEHRLFGLLHAAFFRIDPLLLAQTALQQRDRNEQPGAWRIQLAETLRQNGMPEAIANGLARDWVEAAHNLAPVRLMPYLFTHTGLLPWALEQPDKAWYLQALHTFQEFVQAESLRNPRFSLAELLDMLNRLDENRLPLSLRQPVETGKGIQLLTAHGAKGLEFDSVFIFDTVESAWENNKGDQRGRFAFPSTLTHSGEVDREEARRRLFYVALTRAKRHLWIAHALQDEQGKALQGSLFLSETGLEMEHVKPTIDALLDTQLSLLLTPPVPVLALPEGAVLDAVLSDMSLSVTALNRYLRCPLAFYYENVLSVPMPSGDSSMFGQAMHAAMQQVFLSMKADPKSQFPGAEALQQYFEAEMEKQRAHFGATAFEQRLRYGKEHLRRIYVEQAAHWRRRVVLERRIDRVTLDNVPINGVLDKIEWLENGTLRIVDYKTGRFEQKKHAAPTAENPHGGEYWRQMAFYTLLLQNARIYSENVEKTAVSWLEPDDKGNYRTVEISFDAGELETMRTLIRDTWDKIQSRQFNTGCGKTDCPWCRLHRERNSRFLSLEESPELQLDEY